MTLPINMNVITYLIFATILVLINTYKLGIDKLRIAGGKMANKNQFPFFVQIRAILFQNRTYREKKYCSGSLIHPQWVLTAGHCFSSSNQTNMLINEHRIIVTAGTVTTDDPKGPKKHVIEIHTHPNFTVVYNIDDPTYVEDITNDVALLKIAKRFKLSLSIKTIPLANPKGRKLCKNGYVIGIGRTSPSSKISKDVLYANIGTLDSTKLSNPVNPKEDVFYSEIKLLKGHTLEGDSGGPFVCGRKTLILYGVVSNGYESSYERTYITEYAAVVYHLKFIQRYVPNVNVSLKSWSMQNYKGEDRNDTTKNTDQSNHQIRTSRVDYSISFVIISYLLIRIL